MTNHYDMTAASRVKGSGANPSAVAVIASAGDLHRAGRLRRPPDFFELRLDAFGKALEATEGAITRLAAPLIITARHPAEGGQNNLPWRERRDLLLRFLPHASYLDVELRSIGSFHSVLAASAQIKGKRIVSVHTLKETPPLPRMRKWAQRARAASADVFKLVTRTDEPGQLARLLAFFDEQSPQMRISAMGIGRLGRTSRLQLLQRGSCMNYAYLDTPQTEGQLSLEELRKLVPGG